MSMPAGKHYALAAYAPALVALAHAAITCAYALTRLYTYKASLMDIGTFDQVLWNLVHHAVPLSTTNAPHDAQNWFGFHFSPILLLLMPVYALWPHPQLLQIVQSLCLGFAGTILFYALRAAGAGMKEAWAGALLYWCSPFVTSAAIWDFHEIAFSTLFIATALWALCARRFAAMMLALFLLLATKEHYGLSVAGFGFLWGWRHGEWKRGAAIMVAGVLAFVVVIGAIMPAFSSAHIHPMLAAGSEQANRYAWLSTPWPQASHRIVYLLFMQNGGNMAGILYLLLLLLSGLMLPLLAPLYLAPGAADLLANLLSSNPMPRHIVAYHSAALIPVIIVAAYMGYHTLPSAASRARLACLALLLFISPVVTFGFFPFQFWELTHVQLSADSTLEAIQHAVPRGPVVAESDVGMFFSQRSAIYPFPDMLDKADTVVLYLHYPYTDMRSDHFGNPYLSTGALPPQQIHRYANQVRALLSKDDWHISYWQAPWLVLTHEARDDQAQRISVLQALIGMEK